MYRTLSEIKSEIETVIRTGRKVCEDRATKSPKKLGLSIDALKHLYNALGEHVTQSKQMLERLFKMATALADNIVRIEHLLSLEHDGSANVNDTNTQIETLLAQSNAIFDQYRQTCEATYLEDVRHKLDALSARFYKGANVDVVKKLFEYKTTLHNLDSISLDKLRYSLILYLFLFLSTSCFRTIEEEVAGIDTTNELIQSLHQQVLDLVKVCKYIIVLFMCLSYNIYFIIRTFVVVIVLMTTYTYFKVNITISKIFTRIQCRITRSFKHTLCLSQSLLSNDFIHTIFVVYICMFNGFGLYTIFIYSLHFLCTLYILQKKKTLYIVVIFVV